MGRTRRIAITSMRFAIAVPFAIVFVVVIFLIVVIVIVPILIFILILIILVVVRPIFVRIIPESRQLLQGLTQECSLPRAIFVIPIHWIILPRQLSSPQPNFQKNKPPPLHCPVHYPGLALAPVPDLDLGLDRPHNHPHLHHRPYA
jgi:hypothetical protein